MDIITEDAPLRLPNASFLRLLQLVSPALPIGAFAYSQALETAIDRGWLRHGEDVAAWVAGVMESSLGSLDVPVFVRLHRAFADEAWHEVTRWNAYLLATRPTAELRAEDGRLGLALLRVLEALDVRLGADGGPRLAPPAHVTAFALAATRFGIDVGTAAAALVFSWAENQISAAVRLVPLGQSTGQAILAGLAQPLLAAVERGLSLPDEALATSTPGQAIASALHETQYSRLFRS